jgi:hypothetical protein
MDVVARGTQEGPETATRLYTSNTYCTRKTLDTWPALSLIIHDHTSTFVDNLIAALERRDRVCKIDLR